MQAMESKTELTPVGRMLEKAMNLYEDGYWIKPIVGSDTAVEIYPKPSRGGRYARPYVVDVCRWTCTCESFTGPKAFRLKTGHRTCKHLEGIKGLAKLVYRDRMASYEATAGKLNGTADTFQRRMMHMGCRLETAFGYSPEIRQADDMKDSAEAIKRVMRHHNRPVVVRGAEVAAEREMKAA